MEIAVISGKGGTGKSSISAAFATLEKNVLVADCDVDAANLHLIFSPTHEEEQIYIAGQTAIIDYNLCTHCGICKDYCRFDAIWWVEDRIYIDEITCDGCQLCSRVCPFDAITMVDNDKSRMYSGTYRNGRMVYGRLAPGEENSGKLVNMVRAKAKSIAKEHNVDKIVIDGPPGIGCAVISSITGTQHVIIVVEPTASGIHDLQRTLELVNGFNLKSWVLVNKYDLNVEMTEEIERKAVEWGSAPLGKLPFDPVFVDAMVNRQSVIEYAPQSEIAKQLKQFWNTITKE